jgi:hypothetical protein
MNARQDGWFKLGIWAFAAVLAILIARPAGAQVADAVCYRLPARNTPNADLITRFSHTETWCYRALNDPAGATFIFRGDSDKIRPETSAIVESDGTLVHASNVGGTLTLHRLKSRYNPLGIPLQPPVGLPRAPEAESQSLLSLSNQTLDVFRRLPVVNENLAASWALTGEPVGTLSERSEVRPWRGFWWPYQSGRLHRGASSPLAKYDRFVRANSNEASSARAWEARNHGFVGVQWSGHCNGWAAAAMMRPEPRQPKHDPVSGVTFSVSDLKGILTEKDKCVETAFFGSRYDGIAGDDINDIYAADFHETLLYYIGKLHNPVAMDHMRGVGVQNQVISAYKMNITRLGADEFDVQTVVTIHRYDDGWSNRIGEAPTYQQRYRYKLWMDGEGAITASQWLSDNPDFLWAPLAPQACGFANSQLSEEWIAKIMAL